jgi:hypothetical protein
MGAAYTPALLAAEVNRSNTAAGMGSGLIFYLISVC